MAPLMLWVVKGCKFLPPSGPCHLYLRRWIEKRNPRCEPRNLVQSNLNLIDSELFVAEAVPRGKVDLRPRNDEPAAKLSLSDENCWNL